MSWFEKRRQRQPMLLSEERIARRFNALRCLDFDAIDANKISRMLEYRVLCHERLGGVTEIIVDDPADPA